MTTPYTHLMAQMFMAVFQAATQKSRLWLVPLAAEDRHSSSRLSTPWEYRKLNRLDC